MSLADKLKKNKILKEYIVQEEDTKEDFINTGAIPLNILFSGRIHGGIPVGKMSMFAAPSASGKSFVGMKLARNAQKREDWIVVYVDTEMAFDFSFASSVGLDLDRTLVIQSNRIEEVQQQIMAVHDSLEKEERERVLLIIDSWGGLITSKTVEDASSGKDVTDMTISKKKNSLARLITGLGMTVFVVNHVYDSMNMYDPLAIGGGRGLFFASSSIVLGTSKAKFKETASANEINGVIVSAVTKKSRFCKENSKMKFLIKYEGGIHPYYGILEDALEGGYVVKPTMGWYSRAHIPDDKKFREKEIWENPKEFWGPIITQTDFPTYIEKKYTFKHSEIVDEDFDFENQS